MSLHEALTLTMQYLNAGQLREAEQTCRQILDQVPDEINAIQILGVIARRNGDNPRAIELYRKVVALNGSVAEHHGNLGNALQATGQADEALACFRKAVELKPEFAPAHFQIGAILLDRCERPEAMASLRRALQLQPSMVTAHVALGYALADEGEKDAAAACYVRALQLQPDFAAARNALGILHLEIGRLDEAADCFETVLAQQPDHYESLNNLGNVFRHQGRLVEAVDCYRRTLAQKPDNATAHSNYLAGLQYVSDTTPEMLAEAHAEYERRQGAPRRAEWRAFENDRNPERRLRIGFASHDFCRHPVTMFLLCAVEHFDPGQCETFCYNFRRNADDMTARLKRAATHWRDMADRGDADVAAAIRADRIDILFDLAGHTTGNRLPVFARKPAPIQITWAGYTGTTGLKAMDYILADRFEVPPELEKDYAERVLRMPHDYICYEPPAYAPPVATLPASKNGYVTFGCFNNPSKLSPEILDAWARLLKQVPQSRLVLKYKGFELPSVCGRIRDALPAGRVEFRGPSPHPELLAAYREIDLALDTYPYAGGLTTCEALWIGVPVVTCPGRTFASRHSLSHLSNAGVTETIAYDLNEYVELAAALATDLPRLEALRHGLREKVASSPLCDRQRFAADMTDLLRVAWRAWCEIPPAVTSSQPGLRAG